MNILRLSNARFAFSSEAAWSVDFTFVGGTVYQLIGENGSGKSTVGKLASGILPCNSGNSYLNGTQISEMSIAVKRENFFYVPQEPHWSFIGDTFCSNLTYFLGESQSCMQRMKLYEHVNINMLVPLATQSVFSLSSEHVFSLAMLESAVWERTVLFADECPDLHDEGVANFFKSILMKRIESNLITIIARHVPLNSLGYHTENVLVDRFSIS